MSERGASDIAETRSAYLGEIDRLRTLIIETADDLELGVVPALVALCQHSTDDNADQRCALLELRTLIAKLKASGRPFLPEYDGLGADGTMES